MSGRGPEIDPRSPVQPGGKSGPYLVFAVIVAFGVWAFQQIRIQDSNSAASKPEAAHASQQDNQSTKTTPQTMTGLFSGDDYPPEALDRGEQGTVNVRVDVDYRGRVRACTVLESSGSQTLDRATCRIIANRARFGPALDTNGKAIEGVITQKITWRIAD